MSKKLAVGPRKAGMKGKRSASKRELIEAGEDKNAGKPASAGPRKSTRKVTPR
ncbi:MAG: hypothetical protein M3468_14790 [Acidobacteriota bacterium]|nr:hypothetical protein [Acidobacteriota bacterium]